MQPVRIPLILFFHVVVLRNVNDILRCIQTDFVIWNLLFQPGLACRVLSFGICCLHLHLDLHAERFLVFLLEFFPNLLFRPDCEAGRPGLHALQCRLFSSSCFWRLLFKFV